ncbi:hypothetical protein [Nonomuraea solani]|nr:hypothetical protein [Nonomuraea solani]
MTMIEQWMAEDERELEARCARFRVAKLALERSDDDVGVDTDETGSAA